MSKVVFPTVGVPREETTFVEVRDAETLQARLLAHATAVMGAMLACCTAGELDRVRRRMMLIMVSASHVFWMPLPQDLYDDEDHVVAELLRRFMRAYNILGYGFLLPNLLEERADGQQPTGLDGGERMGIYAEWPAQSRICVCHFRNQDGKLQVMVDDKSREVEDWQPGMAPHFHGAYVGLLREDR